MRVALAVNKITSDFDKNVKNIIKFIKQAGEMGADLILFPETALTGLINNNDPNHDINLGIEIPGKYTDLLSSEAKKSNINLALGVFERKDGKLYDSAIFITREGEIGLKYRRISKGWHFPNSDPNVYIDGDEIGVFNSDIGKVCFLICGDLFDDGLISRVNKNDAELLLYPFARAFYDGSLDQQKWENEELENYINKIVSINKTTFMTNYLGSKDIEDNSFGGAFVVSKRGEILKNLPLGKEGILIVDVSK